MALIEFKKLKIFRDLEGDLFETLRCDDEIFSGIFGQNLVSIVNPGIIKGLHLHKHQTDYTCCINGDLKYIAVIERGSKNIIESFNIGENNPLLLKIPPLVWHGYTPLNNKSAIVLHTMDRPYNSLDTDTLERSPFYFGNVWKI